MIDYGLKDKVAIITGANNPWGIGATTAIAFAREGAKVVLVYKKVDRPFDATKMDRNGVDRYYGANAGNADAVESKLKEMGADYIILESDISNEDAIKEIYSTVLEKYGRVNILFNNAATDDETGCDTIETITQDVIDNTFAVTLIDNNIAKLLEGCSGGKPNSFGAPIKDYLPVSKIKFRVSTRYFMRPDSTRDSEESIGKIVR